MLPPSIDFHAQTQQADMFESDAKLEASPSWNRMTDATHQYISLRFPPDLVHRTLRVFQQPVMPTRPHPRGDPGFEGLLGDHPCQGQVHHHQPTRQAG